jgi:hypothetical protein
VTVAESVLGVPGVQALSVMAPSVPLAGAEAAKVRSQVSISEPVRVTTTGVSSSVTTVLGSAVGRSLMELTVMETEPEMEVAVPSLVV